MNINNITNIDFSPCLTPPANIRPTPASDKPIGNFDKVTISRESADMDELSFARTLARNTVSELNRVTDPDRVFELQQQVTSGTYKPDAARIAEKLLGYR